MQNRYTGDIGDFAKYGLLRALGDGCRLGIAWYLFPNESHNEDGKHAAYLGDAKKWRHLDPFLFDGLKSIINSNRREVSQIETSGLLVDASFSSTPLVFEGDPSSRSVQRAKWFKSVLSELSECNVVFADPDNGLCEDRKFAMSGRKSWKRMPLSEAHVLAAGRTGIFYHHNSRLKGGHLKEIQHWLCLLGNNAVALYWRKDSNRTFFIINPTNEITQRIRKFAQKWSPYFELHTPQRSRSRQVPSFDKGVSQQNNRNETSYACPECSHQFSGAGWTGIDAHWKAHHEHIMPYEVAWPLIKQGEKPSKIGNQG